MKDFHDLHTLVNTEKTLNRKTTKKAIHAVFEHRKTPHQLPIHFDTSALEALQNYWSRYRQTATSGDALPAQLKQVIESINQWLNQE